MKLYLDTEFIEDGRTIELVSIALVADNGQEFYRQNSQADFFSANDFVTENVLPRLWPCPKGVPSRKHIYGLCADKTCVWRPKRLIRDELLAWVREVVGSANYAELSDVGDRPEFWGYYADYDWVVLCQLFGRMVDLPTGWPMYCRDLKQYADSVGDFDLPPEGKDEHNALSDARWIRSAYDYVVGVERYARERNQRRVSARQVHQESGAVRGVEEAGNGQEHGGGDLELQPQEDRQAQQVGQVVITEADYEKALSTEVRYPDGQEGSPIQ